MRGERSNTGQMAPQAPHRAANPFAWGSMNHLVYGPRGGPTGQRSAMKVEHNRQAEYRALAPRSHLAQHTNLAATPGSTT